jgi:hypothetical protein
MEFPEEIEVLLEKLNAPENLKEHLQIVYKTAYKLIEALQNEWHNLVINEKEILFGAATHDIGKVLAENELYGKGSKHELLGETLLMKNGFSANFARFARTHGNYQAEYLQLEDLLVILADKIWKGKRINLLEEQISKIISAKTGIDFWTTNAQLDAIISDICYASLK